MITEGLVTCNTCSVVEIKAISITAATFFKNRYQVSRRAGCCIHRLGVVNHQQNNNILCNMCSVLQSNINKGQQHFSKTDIKYQDAIVTQCGESLA